MKLEQIQQSIQDSIKPVIDVAAIVTSASALIGLLTNIIGLIGVIASAAWAVVRLWETKTVQEWRKKRKRKE